MSYPSRGAWRFRNQTRGFDFWPTLDSVLISEAHPEDLATFSCSVVDRDALLVFEPEDRVWVTFAGTRIFAGHLKAVEESQLSEVGPRVYGLDAQDYTAKLDDSVIDHPAERAAESVADRVAWLLGFLNFAITTDHVDPPSMTLDAATYDGMTVREALDQVADEARVHYYLDFDADLHLARDEVVSAPFALDDTDPDHVTSFPYTEYRRARDSTDLATAVYVQGESDQSWVTDSGAIATWGRQERSVNDGDLKTATQRSRAGDRALAEQAAPVVDGSLVCWEPGPRGGMKATLRNDLWGLDTTIVLVSVDITAIDPRDEDGEAYLRCEVRFRDRRRLRSSHRDVQRRALGGAGYRKCIIRAPGDNDGARMSTMSSRPRTQADLAMYRERLSRCVQDAIAEFIGRFGDELYRWRPTSQANVVRDYVVDNVKREFPDGIDGFRHHERRGLFLLYIRDEYVLRFKKLGRGRRTMNIPTQLSLDFLAQQPLQLFPGLAPALHLNVGYQPTVTLAASTVWITCPDRNGLQWEWQISEEADATQLPTSITPAGPAPAQVRKPRARPRRLPSTGEMTDGQDA